MKRISCLAILLALALPAAAQPESSESSSTTQFSGADPDQPTAGQAPRAGSGKLLPNMLFAGVDGMLMVPVGSFSDASGVGFGVLGHINYDLRPRMLLTARLGFVYHLEADEIGFKQIQLPVLFGMRYLVKPRIYVAPELGLNFVNRRFEGDRDALWTTKVGLTLSGGYMLNSEVDLRAGLWFPDITSPKVLGIFVSGGWDLWFGRL